MRGELTLVSSEVRFDAGAGFRASGPSVVQDLISTVRPERGDPTLLWLEQFVAELSDATVLVDGMGQRVWDNSAAFLEGESEPAPLSQGIRKAVAWLASELKRRGRSGVIEEIATRDARYRLRGTVIPDMSRTTGAFALLQIERLTPSLPSVAQATTAFGITVREAEISLLLAQRMTNLQIATQLGISVHTARRHTENVFRKLGVRLRGDVMSRLQAGRAHNVKV